MTAPVIVFLLCVVVISVFMMGWMANDFDRSMGTTLQVWLMLVHLVATIYTLCLLSPYFKVVP